MAPQTLTPEEQTTVELWLTGVSVVVVVLIVGLIGMAIFVRYLARRTTQPCRWCMEFIPKKALVCPRCGKNL
jgi:hypothetical protein